jgi:hypothetical protein
MPEQDEQGTRFWTMSIQAPGLPGVPNITAGFGTWTPGEGQTRFDVFPEIKAALTEQYPQCQGGVVLAFDIQPNKL